jgi:hypothetical protein
MLVLPEATGIATSRKRTRASEHRLLPTVNTEAMNEHLKEFSMQVAPGARAVLVRNGAGWHQPGKRLRTPYNITLPPLPPYSPDFNPWRTSGTTCVATSSAGWSGAATRRSSPLARKLYRSAEKLSNSLMLWVISVI